jgi:hypothetical protein
MRKRKTHFASSSPVSTKRKGGPKNLPAAKEAATTLPVGAQRGNALQAFLRNTNQ